jgi:phage tail sheath protein FI
MPTYSAPDVYVQEIKVFPPSVAEVETAIPAFIGYTQMARKDADNDLNLKPTKIYSMTQYEQYFGKTRSVGCDIAITEVDGVKQARVTAPVPPIPGYVFFSDYLLYDAVKLYFDNGGGKCYIVSVGLQSAPGEDAEFEVDALEDGLDAVKLEDEPTLLVIPEAVKLAYAGYDSLCDATLSQCNLLQDRFAIIDVYEGYRDMGADVDVGGTEAKKLPTANRDAWMSDVDMLKYAAAYYPWVKTAMNPPFDEALVNVTLPAATAAVALSTLKNSDTANYNVAKAELAKLYLVLPASGAVAGVYAYTDTNRGVWKAPANIALQRVLEPVVKLDNMLQGELNITPSGKSINAIRAFSGKGTLVWGARTLAGNDNEWRYVNVRRFFSTVEESVKKSTYWAVFEPNDANTWVKVRGMIESYLTQKWREGALAGATIKDAFFVRCGLGTTMTAQDILEGRMNVEIGMAVVRPAEFIILKFSHKMQVS